VTSKISLLYQKFPSVAPLQNILTSSSISTLCHIQRGRFLSAFPYIHPTTPLEGEGGRRHLVGASSSLVLTGNAGPKESYRHCCVLKNPDFATRLLPPPANRFWIWYTGIVFANLHLKSPLFRQSLTFAGEIRARFKTLEKRGGCARCTCHWHEIP